jgi:molecular chaperone Hsp33
MTKDSSPEQPDDRDAPAESAASKYRRRQLERQLGPTQFLDEPPPVTHDTLWRGLARKGEARLLVVRATDAAREAAGRLNASAEVAKLIGELVVSSLLVRSTLNPDARMQVYIRHDGPTGKMVVDTWEGGGVRVYVKSPEATSELDGALFGPGLMEVSRTHAATGKSWKSTVQLQGDRVEDFMMHFLLESEQVLSLLRVEVTLAHGQVQSALGYLVQLMPEGTREDLQRMTANLEAMSPLTDAMSHDDPDARAWAESLMAGFLWDQCAREMVEYECRCSDQRILHMLSTLPRTDLEELAADPNDIEITCDFCRTRYSVKPSVVATLLEPPS